MAVFLQLLSRWTVFQPKGTVKPLRERSGRKPKDGVLGAVEEEVCERDPKAAETQKSVLGGTWVRGTLEVKEELLRAE